MENKLYKIIKEVCGHQFDIGEIVTIQENRCNEGHTDYIARKVTNSEEYWFVIDEEIEEIETEGENN